MTDLYIRIISINTWKGEGNYFQRMTVLANQLNELQPHILVCQECFMVSDSHVSTADILSQELKMNVLFTPARLKKRSFNNEDVISASGLAVLSVFPIRIIKEIELPFASEDGQRKIQIVSVEIAPGLEILITNVHLTHLLQATALRSAQLKTIAEAMRQQHNFNIKLICGDFNAEIDSQEIRFLKSLLKPIDAYAKGGGKYPRLNTHELNDFQLKKAVDHILALPDTSGNYPVFSDSRIVLNEADQVTGLYASDHPGIFTTLHCSLV